MNEETLYKDFEKWWEENSSKFEIGALVCIEKTKAYELFKYALSKKYKNQDIYFIQKEMGYTDEEINKKE